MYICHYERRNANVSHQSGQRSRTSKLGDRTRISQSEINVSNLLFPHLHRLIFVITCQIKCLISKFYHNRLVFDQLGDKKLTLLFV